MGRKTLHDLTLILHAETEKALKVSETGEDKEAQWLPKSQIEFSHKGAGVVEVTLPEWLASEKGFSGF